MDNSNSQNDTSGFSLFEAIDTGHFGKLLEFTSDIISLHGPEGKYEYVSPSCKEILGYERDEMIGKNAYDFFHPDDIPRINQHHKKALDRYTLESVDYRIQKKTVRFYGLKPTIN